MYESLLISFCVLGQVFSQVEPPKVTIAQGTVVGSIATDGNYNVFYGIPYAGSTAGVNRFKAPTPAPNFPGEYHAHDSSKICAQPSGNAIIGDEDCLVLNVYTKNMTTPKPVIVWIDGEDYTTTKTNARYTFRKLVDKDVVVVAINYRMSIFGFLCLGVKEAPGNAGLKDVIAALQWINRNIAQFGGNPNNVVLFGHGSGAAMVDLVTLSPLSENLVHKAIASSGTSLAPWAVAYNPIDYAIAVGKRLNYTGSSNSELAMLLLETELSAFGPALAGFNFLNNTALFAPCIEDVKLNPNNTFLGSAPIDIIRSGRYNQVPFITGYADRDGTHRLEQAQGSNFMFGMRTNFTNALPADLTNRLELTASVKDFYFGSKEINLGAIEDYFDFQGDTMFLLSTIRAVSERVATSTAPVRLYQFAYRGTQNSDWTYPGVAITGARHRSILNYIFDYDLVANDIAFQDSLVSRWVAFANTGLPYTSTNVVWSPVASTQSINFLEISRAEQNSLEVNSVNPHSQRRAFWDPIYLNNYVKPISVAGSAGHILGFSALVTLCQIVIRLF